METLPALPAEQILSYLDVTDLLACSLVSTGWRAAVNIDCVWKKVCQKQSNKSTIEYVRTVPSKVLPIYQDPEPTSKLIPLCYWRLIYLRLQHLKRNWRLSNHETYEVTDLAYNHFELKIDNNLLVANVNDNQCEVWDIKGAPYKLETIVCALKNARCKCMIHLGDNRLVIVQDTVLQVYHKSGKKFLLVFRRLFNQPEEASVDIPKSSTIDDWYKEIVTTRPTHLQAFHAGKYFIGLAQNGSYENSSFHIWDTITGSKLKEESVKNICPEIRDPVHNVKFCSPKMYISKILVCVTYARNDGNYAYYTVIYIYDLPLSAFKKLRVLKPHVPWIYYENNIVITLGRKKLKLSVFDSNSGEQVVSKRYEEIINPDSVQVERDYLGFTTGGDLVILNVKDFDLVFTTAVVKFSSNLFGFDFVFLHWNMVLITRWWDHVNKIEVWSIDEKRLLSTLGGSGLMLPCNNFAKFFVWNEMVTTICMMQFW